MGIVRGGLGEQDNIMKINHILIITLPISLLIILFSCTPSTPDSPYLYGDLPQIDCYWEKHDVSGTIPHRRSSTQSTFIQDNKNFLFSGATRNYYDQGVEWFDDIWKYDVIQKEWNEINVNGAKPQKRLSFSLDYAGYIDGSHKILMFGGVNELEYGSEILGDTWEFDLSTNEWTEINTNGVSPSPRTRSNMVYVGDNKVILFGGQTSFSCEGETDDTWEYDLNTHSWSEIIIDGVNPPPRNDYAMAYIPNGKVIIQGGWHHFITGYRDSWEYDVKQQTWERIEVYNLFDLGGHSMAYIGNNRVAMMAGVSLDYFLDSSRVYIYDSDVKEWYECNVVSEEQPAIRRDFAMSYSGNNSAIIFGGYNFDSSEYDDTWELSVVD